MRNPTTKFQLVVLGVTATRKSGFGRALSFGESAAKARDLAEIIRAFVLRHRVMR